MTEPSLEARAAEMYATLLEDTHLAAPDELADLLARRAAPLGIDELIVYLADYEERSLVPLPRLETSVDRPVLEVDGTLAGRAYADTTVYEVAADRPGHRRLWLPLLDGTDRLGVVELTVRGPVSEELLAHCERYVHLAAQMILSKGAYSDVFERARRRRTMTVAAELQWHLLPPMVFATRGLVVAGALEPCYAVGGDSFDYAVSRSVAELAVFDAMGHGLAAATTAAVTVAAYRNARRELLDLADMYAAVHATVRDVYAGERFATAVLARLDLDRGRLRWISAGHPAPLLLRSGGRAEVLELRPATPLGMPLQAGPVPVGEVTLEPGDRLLLYTDGVVEARTPAGESFTVDRLAEFLERAAADGRPTPETLRRLRHAILGHHGGQLKDDATVLLVEWRRDSELALLPGTVDA